jgi:hypothetical protein
MVESARLQRDSTCHKYESNWEAIACQEIIEKLMVKQTGHADARGNAYAPVNFIAFYGKLI